MKKTLTPALVFLCLLLAGSHTGFAQVSLLQDYQNTNSPVIGTFQGISFREAGFSGLYPIPGTNGKEFWTVSDRGVNVDCASANPSGCTPTYDKMYAFPSYAPKIHRIRLNGSSIEILQTITIKRPSGSNASGILNPSGLGSTAAEVASTDTVLNCANFNSKTAPKDTFGIDSEGLIVDKDGNFWICEEGGPTIWKVNQNGKLLKRYTPYFNLPGLQSVDVAIDTVFKYRKNNRGFEAISITPNGKIYAIIQSPVLYPNLSAGENTRVHRILEIDPSNNTTKMYVYLNDGIIGSSGANQIRLRDWKVGDMAAVNDSTFLVLEAAIRGTSDIRRVYMINLNGASTVHSGLYGGMTLEALVDSAGLAAYNIKAVRKTLLMDLLANSWPAALDKAEGIAIINDSTIAIGNDNDYGQTCPLANGIAIATSNTSHVFTYRLSGSSKLPAYLAIKTTVTPGLTGPSTFKSPYLFPTVSGGKFTSILTAGDSVGSYKMAGLPDGMGAYDNGNGTFTVLINHEMGNTSGAVHAHGSQGAFVSKWIVNKSDLSVVSGSDLTQNVYLWNGSSYTLYNASNPSALAAFNRFCSADLPEVTAFYNPSTGLGTQARIFMNGEESGNEGRAFGHIATGTAAGNTYELPYLGKFSWENSVASPTPSDKTVVAGMDDSTPGQVYFYVGTKRSTGTDIDKAGLNGGKLYGVAVNGLATETSASVPAPNTTFTLVDMGQVQNMSGTNLNTNSNILGVTTFLRPEDGAWDPSNPSDFYFVSTNAFNSPSRMWRLRFANPANPELGGTITAVLDGTEGQQMMDNIGIDNNGHILIVEDVGGNAHIGKTWQYKIATDQLTMVALHDSTRFLNGSANFLTQDEEASGIIDAQSILGPGMFLTVDQAHHSMPGPIVEGGQLLAFYNPESFNSSPEINITGNGVTITDGNTLASLTNNTDFGKVGSIQIRTFVIQNTGVGLLNLNGIQFSGANASDFALVSPPSFPWSIAANASQTITVKFVPGTLGIRKATLQIMSNDLDEKTYDFALSGTGITPGVTGPSTLQTPYLVPTVNGGSFTSILTAGDSVGSYKMAGLPDGIGAYDNGNGTFTVLINHEMANNVGAVHAHGSTGAFVSKWVIRKSDLSVLNGSDLTKNVYLWNGSGYTLYNASNPSALAAFNRFCSADLPAVTAFYNPSSGLGTQERIFMNGEESGNEGRAFGHIATGAAAGSSYELPYLGKFSWENSVASPTPSDKTIVAGMDDTTPGQVYIYVGTKKSTGTDIDKAGLNGGKLYGIAVTGLATETSGSVPAPNTAFAMVDMGQVQNMTGTTLNTNSNNAGVTTFLRPEDGAWDPSNPSDFYFVTTNAFNSPSRMWKLRFTNILNPELGGTITAVLSGTEGQQMMDNIGIDNYGHILIVEDVGGNAHIGKTWQYDMATDALKMVAEHDQTRFLNGAANFLTQDEEASGIIDASDILGAGMFLTVDQAHYSIATPIVEGGQLLAFYNPDTYTSTPEIELSANAQAIVDGSRVISPTYNTDFGKVSKGSNQQRSFDVYNSGPGNLMITGVSFNGDHASDFSLLVTPSFPLSIPSGTSYSISVQFTAGAAGNRNAIMNIMSNDMDEKTYDIALAGTAVVQEINVQGNALNITDGDASPTHIDHTHFGSVGKGSLEAKTFSIQNTGTDMLQVNDISFNGTHASEFSLLAAPAFPWNIAASGSQTIIVQFAPLGFGLRTAGINIVNNDADEASYDFMLQGTGVPATGIASANASVNQLTLYPNPTTDEAIVSMKLEQHEHVSIRVTDLQGREVFASASYHLDKGQQQLSLRTSTLVNGIYFVEVDCSSFSGRIKMVVMH